MRATVSFRAPVPDVSAFPFPTFPRERVFPGTLKPLRGKASRHFQRSRSRRSRELRERCNILIFQQFPTFPTFPFFRKKECVGNALSFFGKKDASLGGAR